MPVHIDVSDVPEVAVHRRDTNADWNRKLRNLSARANVGEFAILYPRQDESAKHACACIKSRLHMLARREIVPILRRA